MAIKGKTPVRQSAANRKKRGVWGVFYVDFSGNTQRSSCLPKEYSSEKAADRDIQKYEGCGGGAGRYTKKIR